MSKKTPSQAHEDGLVILFVIAFVSFVVTAGAIAQGDGHTAFVSAVIMFVSAVLFIWGVLT